MSGIKNILKGLVKTTHSILTVALETLANNDSIEDILHELGYKTPVSNTVLASASTPMSKIGEFIAIDDEGITIAQFAETVDQVIIVSSIVDEYCRLVVEDLDEQSVNELADYILQLCLLRAMVKKDEANTGLLVKIARVAALLSDLPASRRASGTVGIVRSSLLFMLRVLSSVDRDLENWAKGSRDEWAAMSVEDWRDVWALLAPADKKRLANEQIKLFSDGIYFVLVVPLYFVPAISEKIKVTYGFDPPGDASITVGDQISERAITISMTDKKDEADLEMEITWFVSMAIRSSMDIGGVGMELALAGQGKLEYNIGRGWKLSTEFTGIPEVDAKLLLMLYKENQDADPKWLWGGSKGTRLEIGKAMAVLTASAADKDVDLLLSVKDCSFVMARDGGDGFLQSWIPEKGLQAGFDFGVGFSFKKKVYVEGGSGLSVFIPLHTEIGPVTLDAFYLKAMGDPEGGGLQLETSIGFTVDILGITATIQQVGLLHSLDDYSISFKPPTMVGLSINKGGLTGGGFIGFDPVKKEYTGAIELSYKKVISFKAIAIITTRQTGDGPGYSLLVLISAEFKPWQLGLGFTLNGIGGLIGVHREANIDFLREGLKTNALRSILFPENVVANIARIVSDLNQAFPQRQGHLLICPIFKIGWGTPTLITVDLGILIDTEVARLAIFGVVRAILPDENRPLLKLQVNFLGVLDFENKMISFDASLYDSSLLTLTLSGDFGLRIGWGDDPMFILSAGGFHPAFNKDELQGQLLNMQRITISLLSGENPRATLQCYFAITSNTVQFGAKAELYASASGFNVYGYVSYDVLIRSLGEFEASFEAGLALRRNTTVLMGIRVEGVLAGTQPWDLKGKGSISFFFFSISVPFHARWGIMGGLAEPIIEDILARLGEEIAKDANWVSAVPNNNNLHVSVRKAITSSAKPLVHPFSVLTFRQTLVPLEIDLDKFGNKVPKDVKNFTIWIMDSGFEINPVKDQFAPANFLLMDDAEKLSRPSFEPMKSGFVITGSASVQAPQVINKSVDYEFSYLGRKKKGVSKKDKYDFKKPAFKSGTRESAIAASSLSYANNRVSANAPVKVAVAEQQYAIAGVNDLKLFDSELKAGSYTEVQQQYRNLIRQQPALGEQLQVVAMYEVNRN